MALVMGGIILVQINSLDKASDIKKEQFDTSVKLAIAQVVSDLEAQETLLAREVAMNKYLSGYSMSITGSSQSRAGSGQNQGGRSYFSITHREYFGNYNKVLQFNYSDTVSAVDNTKRGRPGEFPSAFDILHDFNLNQQKAMEDNLNYNANLLAMREVQGRDIVDRIDPLFLEQSLKRAISGKGIDLEYEYAVQSFSVDDARQIIASDGYKPGNNKVYYDVLFQRDIDNFKPNYLNLYFPKRSGYIIKTTGILVIPTIILTGLLIGIFVFTILIILRQKKLSIIKNDFINNMTHELKTPISTISLASQMLEDGSVTNTPKTIEHISKVINQESKRLSYQVEKVLQMAVFNEGRLKLRLKEIDINKLVETSVRNFELRVKNQNGTVISELNAKNALIKGDEVHITNVIFNLLDNAVKYSKEIPEITIGTLSKNGDVVLYVKDNGIGISKEHQSQIFERFYRVPTGNVHNVKGFGLGLSYVKKIIDVHSAKIKIDSVVNKGTKFSINFPQNIK